MTMTNTFREHHQRGIFTILEYLEFLEYLELEQFRNFCDVLLFSETGEAFLEECPQNKRDRATLEF